MEQYIIQRKGSIEGYSSFIGFKQDKHVGLVELCSSEGSDLLLKVGESLATLVTATLT